MLVLSFFVIFLIIFSIGIYFGELKLNIKSFNFEMNEKVKSKNEYKISIGIYWFKVLKILQISIEEDGIRILGKKILYKELKKGKTYKSIINRDVSTLNREVLLGNIKKLDMKFNAINLKLKLGTDSTLLTSFLTFITATLISFVIQKGVTQYSPNKHKFIITPMYENRNMVQLFLELMLSLKIKNIVKVANELNNLSKTEHIKHKIKFKEIKI